MINNPNTNESINKNINNSKLSENNNIKKNIINFSSTSNLDLNLFNDFENITIISKKRKKDISNNISKSTVIIPNKQLSFSSNENSLTSNKIKFEDISYNQIDLNLSKNIIRITTFLC